MTNATLFILSLNHCSTCRKGLLDSAVNNALLSKLRVSCVSGHVKVPYICSNCTCVTLHCTLITNEVLFLKEAINYFRCFGRRSNLSYKIGE